MNILFIKESWKNVSQFKKKKNEAAQLFSKLTEKWYC